MTDPSLKRPSPKWCRRTVPLRNISISTELMLLAVGSL